MFLSQITGYPFKKIIYKQVEQKETVNGNKIMEMEIPFVVYLISLLCSLYTIDGKISDRHLFKVMKVMQ